jgi:L-amino acid N-acyltransferase
MIREANEKDLPDILEIYNEAIENTTAIYDYRPHTLGEREIWLQNKKKEGYPVLVFEQDNKAVGFASFGPFRAWPAYKYTAEHSIYVHKSYRKKGIGMVLLKEIIRIAGVRGYKTIVAGIDDANEGSIYMHKKLGFTYSGRINNAGYKFGKWLNLAFYQLELKGPENPVEE